MLIQRVITGIVLIALVLIVLFLFPPVVFLVLSAIVFLYAAWEWSRLMSLTSPISRFAFVLLTFLVALFAFPILSIVLAIIALIWWLVHFIFILMYPEGTQLWSSKTLKGFTGLVIIVPSWSSLNMINYEAHWQVLILFLIIWGTDIIAYFSGRLWGRSKLIPNVSPGKTWAGFFGALITAVILGIIFAFAIPAFRDHKFIVFLVTIITMLFSVLGDLVESMYKRHVGIKDSGNLLPGHGGLLDRIDSLTAAAPIFLLGLVLLQASM